MNTTSHYYEYKGELQHIVECKTRRDVGVKKKKGG